MIYNSLKDIDCFNLATSNEELNERVCALFVLIQKGKSLENSDIAQAFLDITTAISYSEYMSYENEIRVLDWIDRTFDENNDKYMDAIAGLYVQIKCKEAKEHASSKLMSTVNSKARVYLSEAISLIVQDT